MTQKEKSDLQYTLQDVLRNLVPSWHISKESRTAIVKILMIMLMLSKIGHRLPLKVFSQSSPPEIVEVYPGEDNLLSLTELWNALTPLQRAILIYFELQVPHTAEELLDETPGTITSFFSQAENRLAGLPVWDHIVALALSPNLPTSLPTDANELRAGFTDDGTLTLFVTNDSDESKAITFMPDLDISLYASIAGIASNVFDYQNTETEMLDSVTEDIVFEVFDLEPSYS
jgi:hypothetical protein